MAEILATGTLLQDNYKIKKVSYQGRFYNFYIVSDISGKTFQITEFLLAGIPAKKEVLTEEQFIETVDLLKELEHPFLPSVEGGFFHDEKAYLVLAHAGGLNFDDFINMQVSDFTLEDIAARITQLMDGITYLYNRPTPIPFLHIDPLHVTILADGNISLNGFGLHLFLDHYLSSTNSDAFCAPEIAVGKPFTEKAAIYTLGTLIYYMCIKRKWNISRGDNVRPDNVRDDISKEFVDFLVRILHKNPEGRVLDLTTFSRNFNDLVHPPPEPEEEPLVSEKENILTKETASMKRGIKRYALIGGVIFLIILGFVLAISYFFGGSPENGSLFAYILSNEENSISRVNLKTCKVDQKIIIKDKVNSFKISADGKKIFLSCDEEKVIRVIDSRRGKILAASHLEGRPLGIISPPEGSIFYLPFIDVPAVSPWDSTTSQLLKSLPVQDSTMSAVTGLDGKYLFLMGKKERAITVLDVRKQETIFSFPAGAEAEIVARDSTGNQLIVSYSDGSISFYDAYSFTILKSLQVDKGITQIIPLPGDSRKSLACLVLEDKKTIYLLDCSNFMILKRVRTQGAPVALRANHDGSRLYILSSSPGRLAVYNAGSLKLEREISRQLPPSQGLEIWP